MAVFQRGQFGEERYEKEEFQKRVRATFLALMEEDKVFYMCTKYGVSYFAPRLNHARVSFCSLYAVGSFHINLPNLEEAIACSTLIDLSI